MHGYLHGGLFIDFVGEKAPVSVIRLLSLDVVILFMDIIMMGLIIERLKTTGGAATTTPQDHDLEERGVSSAGPPANEPSLDDDEPAEEGKGKGEGEGEDSHTLDGFASGEAVIMDIGLVDLIRDQWRYKPSAGRSRAYLPSAETTNFLRERLGLQVNADGRVVRIDR